MPYKKCPSNLPRKRIYRKIDRTAKTQKPAKSKILDADIDEFISNLSCDTSDMSDDSDFEFDESMLDRIMEQCKPQIMVDIENMDHIFEVVVKKLPSYAQYPARQIKRFMAWCNLLKRANMKLIRAVYIPLSILITWSIHFLFIISTSYKNILLGTYKFIIKVDGWMDQLLDDRVIPSKNPMMSENVREAIAEKMKLSKTPISTKRARELMIHPAASKIKNEATQGQFWEWAHGVGGGAADESTRIAKSAMDMVQGLPRLDMKMPDIDMKLSDFNIGNMQMPDMKNIEDFKKNLQDFKIGNVQIPDVKLPDMKIADMKIPDIDMKKQMNKGKKKFNKLNEGLTSMSKKFTGKFK